MKHVLILLALLLHGALAQAVPLLDFKDSVQALKTVGEDVRVHFKGKAAVYWLRHGENGFNQMLEQLKESQQSGKVLQVACDPDSLEIRRIPKLDGK